MYKCLRWVVVAVFCAAMSVGAARADQIGTGTFTITGLSGPGSLTGDTLTGVFTFDYTTAYPSNIVPIETITITDSTTSTTLWSVTIPGGDATDGGAVLSNDFFFVAGNLSADAIVFSYIPGPLGTSAFEIHYPNASNPTFAYGPTFVVGTTIATNSGGFGNFSLSNISSTPETGSLGLVCIGLMAVMLSFLRKQNRRA